MKYVSVLDICVTVQDRIFVRLTFLYFPNFNLGASQMSSGTSLQYVYMKIGVHTYTCTYNA